MRFLLIALIRIYQYTVSPLITFVSGGPCCRFEPTCSVYAIEALRTHGALRGSWLTIVRICRCQPWGGHGFDPVPAPGRSIEDVNSYTNGPGNPNAEIPKHERNPKPEISTPINPGP